MEAAEAAALLGVAASFDNRKPDRDAAMAWALALDGVRVDDARAAIIGHYRSEHRWIMPSDVMKGVRRIVQERQAELHNMDLPVELAQMEDGPEFNAAYLDWVKTREVPQGQLTA